MTVRRPRPFGIVDVAILLAFLGGSVLVANERDIRFLELESRDRRDNLKPDEIARRPGWIWDLEIPARRVVADLQAFLVVATLGVGTATLRRPGLMGRGSRPMPGVVAGTVGSMAVIYCLALNVSSIGSRSFWGRVIARQFFISFLSISAQGIQGTILGAWVLIVLMRSWRSRPDDWDDRLGRTVAWSWFVFWGYNMTYPAIWT